MKDDLEERMLAAAISAVLLFETEESIIKISSGRNKGSLWFQEHTRISIGDKVKQGDVLAILEAMKMQNEIVAPIKGIIKQINCDSGDSIIANAPLIIIEGKK